MIEFIDERIPKDSREEISFGEIVVGMILNGSNKKIFADSLQLKQCFLADDWQSERIQFQAIIHNAYQPCRQHVKEIYTLDSMG